MNVCVRREGLQQNMVARNLGHQREREGGRRRDGYIIKTARQKKVITKTEVIRQQWNRGKVLNESLSEDVSLEKEPARVTKSRSLTVSLALGSTSITTAGVETSNCATLSFPHVCFSE